jgi:3-deoxy-manno-octulosonate cytidylyltransferase (CMP-KDO synthetase)
VNLRGSTGEQKMLIQRSWEAATKVRGVDRVLVSTDDDRIRKAAKSFGAEVVMTSKSCKNGTERCAETIQNINEVYDVVVNLQGDAPLTPHWFVEDLIKEINTNKTADVVTPVLRCDFDGHRLFVEDRKNDRVGGTTVVFSKKNKALYFSKEVIPYTSEGYEKSDFSPVFHHVGVYAYRQTALTEYLSFPEGTLEVLEGLEQLRFLENDRHIFCVEVNGKGQSFWELNNPEDILRVESNLLTNNLV